MSELKLQVSMVGAEGEENLRELGMVPRGCAVMTSSGQLEEIGILAIAHAATGAMNRTGGIFEPTLESVALSIENSFRLMRANGFNRIAIPFLASGIFLNRIGADRKTLARAIIDACRSARHDNEECVLVIFGDEDAAIFVDILEEESDGAADQSGSLTVREGSITDFSLHECPVIVNAANMEVQFGGGLSGVIGKATGQPDAIDREARTAVESYYEIST